MFDTLKNHFNRWGGGISLFFCFTNFSQDLMTSLLITLLPFIRQDMMLNYFQAGLLVSAYSVTSGLSQILDGWLSDRWGNRRTVLLTLIAIGPAILLFTAVNCFPALAVLMIAVGILWTMRETAVQTYLMEKTPLHMHGLVIGIYFGVGRQGQSLLQPVYGDVRYLQCLSHRGSHRYGHINRHDLYCPQNIR